MLRFENVSKKFGEREVLSNVSFTVNKGEIVSIVGPSGTGKSVTLKHIVGLLKPDSGKIFLGDDEISAATGKNLARIRRRFGYLFQGGALLGWLTLAENIALPLREALRLDEDEIDARVEEALEAVGLSGSANLYPSEVSGGMQKRAGLARAIVRRCDIVLYDEPTSGLDPVTSVTIDNLIKRVNEERHITSIVVTHDLRQALLCSDRIVMLKDARVQADCTPDEFVSSDIPAVKDFLAARFITKETYEKLREDYEKKR